MQPKTDELITWGGLHNQPDSAAVRVRIFDDVKYPGRSVVILTEPEDNPGTSVTNGIDFIVPIVCERFGLAIVNVTVIEHYDARSGRPSFPETFDVCTFLGGRDVDRNGRVRLVSPQWKRIDKTTVLESIGGEL